MTSYLQPVLLLKWGGLNQHSLCEQERHLLYLDANTATKTLFLGTLNWILIAHSSQDQQVIKDILQLFSSLSPQALAHIQVAEPTPQLNALYGSKATLEVWAKRLGISLEHVKKNLLSTPKLLSKGVNLQPFIILTDEMRYHADEEARNSLYEQPEIDITTNEALRPATSPIHINVVDPPFRRAVNTDQELIRQRLQESQFCSIARRQGISRNRHFTIEVLRDNISSTMAIDSFGPV